MSAPGEDRIARGRRRLFGGAIGAFILLVLQGAAGIYLNLFVPVPATNDYGTVFTEMFQSAAGIVHFLLALALVIGGVTMILNAWQSRDPSLKLLTVIAFLLVLTAAYSGFHFIYAGENAYSFTMELSFLGIILCEAAILARLAMARPPAEPLRPAATGNA